MRFYIFLSAALIFIGLSLAETTYQFSPDAAPVVTTKLQGAAQRRWREFPSGERWFGITGMTPRYFWLGSGWCGVVQRYNVRKRTLTSFTSRDGLPLAQRSLKRVVPSDDGRCLILLEHEPHPFLYTEKLGWRALPDIPPSPRNMTRTLQDIAFDIDGSVLMLVRESARKPGHVATIFKLEKNAAGTYGWEELASMEMSNPGSFIPLSKTFLVPGYDSKARKYFLLGLDRKTGETTVLPTKWNGSRYFRSGLKTYMAYANDKSPVLPLRMRGMMNIRELTEEGMVEKTCEQPQMFDWKTGMFLPMQVAADSEKKTVTVQNNVLGEMTFPYQYGDTRVHAVRCINGDVWLGGFLHIGKRRIEPVGRIHEVQGIGATREDQAYYDEKQHRWRRIVPESMGISRVVDFRNRLAWVCKDHDATTMRLMDFSSEKPKVIRTAPRKKGWRLPRFKDRKGRWWIVGYRMPVARLDPDGKVKTYPYHARNLWYNAKTDTVWISCENADRRKGDLYFKLPPERAAFTTTTREEMFDDFSFEVGNNRFSSVSFVDINTPVVQKIQGEWTPSGAMPASISNGRVLFRFRSGVWEYDVKTGRWVHLLPEDYDVSFDANGNRVFANHHTILIYRGDPFEDPNYQNVAKVFEAQKQLLQACLPMLESSDHKAQQYAFETIRDTCLIPPVLQMMLGDPTTPVQTSQWLKKLLASQSTEMNLPSLFRSAFPLCSSINDAPGK